MAVEMTQVIEQGAEVSSTAPLRATERIRALITGRLDRLSERAQSVAAVAAVIGCEFDFDLLQGAAGLSGRETADAVEELVRRRVLLGADERFDFTHDRIREVAYERLLPSSRRVLHREVVRALEAAPSADEHVERLAHHALRGDLRERAVWYLRRAGLRASARSALPESRAWFEQALAVLEGLPETPSTVEHAFEIRLELRPVALQLGEVRQTLQRLHEAEAIARKLGDEARRGRACGHRIPVHSLLGELDEGLRTGRLAFEIAERLGDARLRFLTAVHLEQVHHYRGEFDAVIELATKSLAELPAAWVHEFFGIGAPPSVFNPAWLALTLAERGRFSDA